MVARHSMTLAQAVDGWLQVKTAGRGLSPHTVRAYRADVASFAARLAGADRTDREAAGRVRVAECTPASVTKALSAIQADGAADKSRARLHGTFPDCLGISFSRRVGSGSASRRWH